MHAQLKVVEDDNEFQPVMLATQDQLNLYWPQAAPLLQKVVDRGTYDGRTVQELYMGVLEHRLQAFVIARDGGEMPEISQIVITELVQQPQMAAMTVVAIGGKQADLFRSKFWKHICSWAYMSGIRMMECYVVPGREHMVSTGGFKPAYSLMRKDLTE